MRVLLVQPPFIQYVGDVKHCAFPVGLASLAATLEEAGVEVRRLDCVVEDFEREEDFGGGKILYGMPPDRIREKILAFRPDIIGVSCLFTCQHDSAMEICRLAKECMPDVHVVMGGSHPSFTLETVLADTAVDSIMIGEGEVTLAKLVKVLEESTDAVERDNALSELDGIAWKDISGNVRVNPKTQWVDDLDSLPLPAYHLFPMERYFEINQPQGGVSMCRRSIAVETSRGCAAKCCFCATTRYWGCMFRGRSPEKVLENLKYLKEKYGVREVQFIDDNVTYDKERARRLFQTMIDERLDLKWTVPGGVALWRMDKELLSLMKESGCWYMVAAVESGVQRVLKQVIHKPLDLADVEDCLRTAKKLGMRISGLFVVGFPDETLEEIRRTFEFAKRLLLDHATFSYATPIPGSPLYRNCVEQGLLPKGWSFKDVDFLKPSTASPNWTREELVQTVSAGRRGFYLHLALHNPVLVIKRIARYLRRPRLLFSIIRTYLFGDSGENGGRT